MGQLTRNQALYICSRNSLSSKYLRLPKLKPQWRAIISAQVREDQQSFNFELLYFVLAQTCCALDCPTEHFTRK